MELTGRTLGNYRIETEIGHGGMAVVYRAVDLRTNQPVALKVLSPNLARDPKQRRRFIHEAEQTERLDHPNIVKVYEADQVDGYWFIVMELIEGQTLSAYLRSIAQRLSIERVIQITDAVARGLDYAHEMGIIHRDIKPNNVLTGRRWPHPPDRFWVGQADRC